jgi:hypothetical protein
MPDKETVERMTLRLPLDLAAALKEWAERDERSLHGQVIYLLRQAVKGQEDARKPSRPRAPRGGAPDGDD